MQQGPQSNLETRVRAEGIRTPGAGQRLVLPRSSLETWVGAEWAAACAPRRMLCKQLSDGWALRDHVARRLYPRLLRQGYEVPLAVLLDLSYLYLHGPDLPEPFRPQPGSPVPAALAVRYCQALAAASEARRVRETIETARRALRQQVHAAGGSALVPAPQHRESPGDAAGLLTFLEITAGGLCRCVRDDVRLPAPLRDAVREDTRYEWPPEDTPAPGDDAAEFVVQFLQSLFPAGQDPRWILAAPFSKDETTLLTLASARVGQGADGLDLPVLQTCLEYTPLQLTDNQAARLHHLRRTLSPRENRASRSPELGNHGIARRGGPTAVLRSHLARPSFTERVYLNQVLYFNRFAAQQEPQRALLACVLDRGRVMRSRRADGRRPDAVARVLADCLLEDAVRYLQPVAALELAVAVVLHNGEEQEFCMRTIAPPPELLASVPAWTPGRDSRSQWLPRADGFMPEYFLREPVWPLPSPRVASEGAAALQALSGLARSTRWAGGEPPARIQDTAYDLCHVILCGPAGGVPDGEAGSLEAVARLRALTRNVALCLCAFGEQGVQWSTWPPSTAPALRSHHSAGYGEALPDGQLRAMGWDYLMEQLLRL
jgi:hypothetical protein